MNNRYFQPPSQLQILFRRIIFKHMKKIILEVSVLRKDKIVQMVQMIEKEVGFEHNR